MLNLQQVEKSHSFYAKGVNPGGGTVGVRTAQNFGTGGGSTTVNTDVDETLVLTASWQRFEVTFTPPSISGKTIGTGGNDYFAIFIGQITDTSTDAWNMDISNVQLEFGDTATDFEYVNPADQLARCQRYFERLQESTMAAAGHCESATQFQGLVSYSNTKRSIPTISFSSQTGFSVLKGGANAAATAMSSTIVGKSSALLIVTAAALISGQGASLAIDSSEYIDIDAEL